MQVIEQKTPKHDSPEEASDALAGLSHINGFVFGYVEEKENRAVAFFQDAFPSHPLQPGQQRRTLVFAPSRQLNADRSAKESLKAIGDAIMNGKDLTR